MRVIFNPLGEDYSQQQIGAAYFGLQLLYWKQLHNGLTGLDIKPSVALRWGIVPVFKHDNQYYLLLSSEGKSLYSLNCLGDNDAVTRAKKEQIKAEPADIEGTTIGLDEYFFRRYLALRKQINETEITSQREALGLYVETPSFQKLAEFLTFADKLKGALRTARYFRVLYHVEEMLSSSSLDVQVAQSAIKRFCRQLAVAVHDYIYPDLDEIYDGRLRQNGY